MFPNRMMERNIPLLPLWTGKRQLLPRHQIATSRLPRKYLRYRRLNALDLSLGVLTIGDPADKVRKALGEPNSTNAKDNGHTFCKYNSMEVVLYQDKVSALVSYSAEAETPRGIHNDSTAQDVFNAYGTDYIESTYEGLTLYEYKVTSQDGHPCYLRFAVRGSDQKVDYISARFQ